MANPTNSIDLYDKDFDTTHALMLAEKQDKVGRESTPAQQNTIAGQHIGNFYDDFIKAMRDQGALPIRYTDATADATPSAQTVKALTDGTATWIEMKAWGKVGANDMVFREIRRRYQRNGGVILVDTDYDSGNLYSAGGSLTTAAIALNISGTSVEGEVTGEVATTIAWQLYVRFLEGFTP